MIAMPFEMPEAKLLRRYRIHGVSLLPCHRRLQAVSRHCCGTHGEVGHNLLQCAAQRPHGIWQLAQRACPATFASNPADGQLQLHPVTDNGTAVLSFDVPGTVRRELYCRCCADAHPEGAQGGNPRPMVTAG